jgi:hypothetical protein
MAVIRDTNRPSWFDVQPPTFEGAPIFPELHNRRKTDQPAEQAAPAQPDPEYTGGSVSYYKAAINNPTEPGRAPYVAECNDIIEALGMNFAEGNAFKAIWRKAAARQGKRKKGYDSGLYDAEKVAFFGARMVAMEKAK